MRQVFLSVLLLLSSCLTSCIKEERPPDNPKLPPLTFEGRDTYGCKIDGKNWVPYAPFDIYGPSKFNMNYYPVDSHRVSLRATYVFEDETNEWISFDFYPTNGKGDYEMFTYPGVDEHEGYARNHEQPQECHFYHRNFDPGTVSLKFWDTTNSIMSASFKVNLYNENCSEDTIMKITHGRFDIGYNTTQ